jgi:hypothetical protein
MQLAWFARLYGRWHLWKESMLAQVRTSWPWRLGRVLKHRAKHRWEHLKQRWSGTPG